jgi:hypothetical protein
MSSALINSSRADSVLAATQKLVQQAMTGQWQDVPKTVQERRELLNNLSASASPQDRQWLGALQQAMAESDAAVAQMAAAAPAAQTQGQGVVPVEKQGSLEAPNTAAVDSMMEMLKKSR